MPKLIAQLALSAGLAAAAAVPATAGEGTYDGTWSVELVTESGLCDTRYSYSLTVQDGQVRPVSRAASSGATVTGRVGADGSVGLNVATAAASGSASGRLQARSGAGTWRVSALCSGHWTARRSTVRTAQAE
ncbi:hypothetical protein [Methylobacterium organophilum]|uniref:Large exoprotein involved in heme utilization or adhesion n=1 Tax=Methylobacterium organophilum TaxID=410 RepID=A0ABQ4T4T1_METOR|nr:hypothetical protein [Methylobacterium organophilum]GJE26670.1 hypothetical protein LKMONMHP_1521 [Methylobacterium organophilum]